MKKMIWTLAVAIAVSACTDSSPDVTSVARESALVPPDTVFVSEGVTIEIYGRLNEHTRERTGTLSSTEGVRHAFEALDESGIVRDAMRGVVVRATDADGRSLETTWMPATHPSRPNELTGVAHFQLDGDEFVVPFGDRDKPEILTIDGKEAGPQGAIFGGCYEFARALFMSCVSLCGTQGMSEKVCRLSCQSAGIAALTSCVLMSAAD